MKISFEFFPPRTEDGLNKLIAVKNELSQLNPEYFSITFGAGGTTQDSTFNTIQTFTKSGNNAVPHLSCIGSEKANILELLNNYKNLGVKKILALRGDIPSGMRDIGDFSYASDLVKFIKDNFNNDFEITVAAYPEKHPQAKSIDSDIKNLVNKFELGADSAITQYFYNIDSFLYFRDEVAKQSDKLIIPGIMPILNFDSLVRFSKMCGAQIPQWIYNKLEVYNGDKKSLESFGFEVVNNLCQNLKKEGVKDFHFYSMNKTRPTFDLAKNLL
jgi:methylenetetrahydrofolate reductase (NADPH)